MRQPWNKNELHIQNALVGSVKKAFLKCMMKDESMLYLTLILVYTECILHFKAFVRGFV